MSDRCRNTTRWLLLATVLMAMAVAWSILYRPLAERSAVRDLLEMGGSVAFHSDPSRFVYKDERLLFFWEPRVAYDMIEPSGPVVGVSLSNDAQVEALVQHAHLFTESIELFIEESVSEHETAKLVDVVLDGRLLSHGLTCYAKIDRQQTIDRMLACEFENLLLAKPLLPTVRLDALSRAAHLKDLWLVEDGASGDPGDDPERANRCRYNAQSFASLKDAPRLQRLFLNGLDITDEMAAELEQANQIIRIIISQCSLSLEAEDRLRQRLPQTTIEVRRPSEPR